MSSPRASASRTPAVRPTAASPYPSADTIDTSARSRSVRRARIPIVVAILLVVAVLTRQSWLTAAREGLVEHDALAPSEVIVVLAGSSPPRARHAEALYAQGLAPHVIISNEPISSHG